MTLTIFDIIAIAIACNFWGCTVDLMAWMLATWLYPEYITNDYKKPPQNISKPKDLPPPPPTMVPPPKKTGQEIHIRNK